ncbi:hypothetical protein EMCRGX_G015652 [Ephydatia muelleri]
MQASTPVFLLILYSTANAACPSFNFNYPPMRTLLCPGDNITYTCTLSSNSAVLTTLWTGSGFQCSRTPVNSIALPQSSSASLNTVPGSCGNLSAVMTNISGTCYTSVLTIPTPQYFNGTTVTCKDGNFGTLIGSDTLNIQLAYHPNVPTITSLISSSSDMLTVTWTSVLNATSYGVCINDSANTIPSTGAPQYTFTGLTNNTVYTVSVVAINCAGSSSPATITGRTGLSMPAAGPCTAAVGTAVGVSVSVTFSDSSSDTGDLDLSCSFSSVDSDQSEVSELEDTPGTIEPYQFEPLASESDSHTEPEADVVDDDDSGDDERLHSTNWWELACIYEPVDNNFTAMYLLYLTMYM